MRTKTSPKWFEATVLTFPQNEEGLIVRKSTHTSSMQSPSPKPKSASPTKSVSSPQNKNPRSPR